MKIAIVGLGSIGKRHWKNFKDSGLEVCGVSHTEKELTPIYPDLKSCLNERPDVVFICKETALHQSFLVELSGLGFKGGVIVEKPLFEKTYPEVEWPFRFLVVSYQLRFHPLITKLKAALAGQKILTAHFHVGQYLPTWRAGRDYATTYSASRESGGGALRDLSHEIDLALFLTGKFSALSALGGKVSDLNITSDDQFSLLAQTQNCGNVTVHMNYLDRRPQRFILINTLDHTYKVDLIQNEFTQDGETEKFSVQGNDSYMNMVQKIQKNDLASFTDYESGLHLMNVIEAAETSSKERQWVKL